MHGIWADLPETLRARLLQGGVGKLHLFETAHLAFQSINHLRADIQPTMLRMASDMLLANWEANYLEPHAAATLHSINTAHPFLPFKTAGFVKFCAQQIVADQTLIRRLNPSGTQSAADYEIALSKARRRNDAPFFVLLQAVEHAFREQRTDWLRDFILDDAILPEPLKDGLLADMFFADGNWNQAVSFYARAHAALPLLTWEQRRAEALYRLGRRDEAISIWRVYVAARPWQVNTLLRLTDCLMDRDTPPPFPPGRGAVLLYTWNKCQDIDATLASLAASELSAPQGEARIHVLDNGSTDGTADVLRKWEAHFAGRMSLIELPINIGAPAARNWLLALPDVRLADWAAFLDDDVAIPADWLRHLWGALLAYPASGVSSGHAVDYHAPMRQQWTDMHINILPPTPDQPDATFRDRFEFTSLHEQTPDFGDFTFMRPCVTAIGCCHMFTREALDQGGQFDIRYSPSQSDDVDHDMRRGLAGCLPVYNGHLRVRHKRATGYHKKPNRRAWASAVCNWNKLQSSYTDEEVRRLYTLDQHTMLDDVIARLELLETKGSL